MTSWSSWVWIVTDFILLWAAVIVGFAWQMYWAERDHDHDHGHR